MYFPLDQDLNDTLLVIISRFCEYCWFLLLETATLLWLWTNFARSLQERALLSFSPWHFLWNSFLWVSPGPFLFLLKLTVLGTSQLGNCSRTGKPVRKKQKRLVQSKNYSLKTPVSRGGGILQAYVRVIIILIR